MASAPKVEARTMAGKAPKTRRHPVPSPFLKWVGGKGQLLEKWLDLGTEEFSD